MDQRIASTAASRPAIRILNAGLDTRHLGSALRTVYESGIDTQPIPDAQVELLLRLRQKERELRRAG